MWNDADVDDTSTFDLNGDEHMPSDSEEEEGSDVIEEEDNEDDVIHSDDYVTINLVRGGFQPRLPTSLRPPGQQQQPSPLPRRQPVPLMPPAQLHPGAPQVVAPAPAVPLQSPPPSELMDVDPSAGPLSQAVAVQPVLQPLSLGTPKEYDTAAPCPAPTQQPSTQRPETLPLFVGPDAPSRPEDLRRELEPERGSVDGDMQASQIVEPPPAAIPLAHHPYQLGGRSRLFTAAQARISSTKLSYGSLTKRMPPPAAVSLPPPTHVPQVASPMAINAVTVG
ncbi:uncharacterized protein LOC126484694 [Schistocerca serialis cubense]|uniref:uncharacterized protein LOC126484694 n=1 Tax=Schistocerca serialis cubense TaxID=2023355 RepID=UPI00214ECC94|nr:uncharacterized protein LOC126484694 [Schistocerca serialis cubense]